MGHKEREGSWNSNFIFVLNSAGGEMEEEPGEGEERGFIANEILSNNGLAMRGFNNTSAHNFIQESTLYISIKYLHTYMAN